jgi:multidrug efflux pump
VHAAHLRLRPILMTSLAFMLGVMPLALANGAGSGGQNAIGTGVIGGMFAATILAIFFVPLFFVTMLKTFKVKRRHREPDSAQEPEVHEDEANGDGHPTRRSRELEIGG